MPEWPEWWDWEIEVSDHAIERMAQRHFSEVDLRDMMYRATDYTPGEPGRWELETTFDGAPWTVIVEPDAERKLLVVVTAFEID
jgi:hypothetical protein